MQHVQTLHCSVLPGMGEAFDNNTARLAVVGDLRLKRYALRTSVKFVSTIMREHTPLYYTNPLGWISGVVDDEGTSSEESSSESDYDSESD